MFQDTFKIFNALLYTIRPSATLGACLLTVAAFKPQYDEVDQVIVLILAGFFGGAFCFLMNDIFDRKKDLLNNKKRPLATGIFPLQAAFIISFFFALIFITACWFLGKEAFALSFVFLLIASTYSSINQKTGFIANLVVALMVSATQWGVGILKPDDFLWMSSIFLLLFTVPREILLDWLDMPGDQKSGKRSIPLNSSDRTVKLLIAFFLALSSFSIIHIILSMDPGSLLMAFLSLTLISLWVSFIPFFKQSGDKGALMSVRISHITYAFLILALFSR